jgi:hypothetical protein
MRTKRTKEYIEQTAEEHGLRPSQVKDIAESMFRFSADVISEGNRKLLDFSEVRIMKWGVLRVKEGRRKYLERLNNEKSNTVSK